MIPKLSRRFRVAMRSAPPLLLACALPFALACGQIAPQSLKVNVPLSPNTTHTPRGLGAVGMAVNGVAIFGNVAAPHDDIFREAESFDRCGGHPAPMPAGMYHYHGE